MTNRFDVPDLVERLQKQARLYEQIDNGTGYGYDVDAANIREAINLIEAFNGIWDKIESSIYKRLSEVERYNDSRLMMIARTKEKLIGDLREIKKVTVGEDEQPDEDV